MNFAEQPTPTLKGAFAEKAHDLAATDLAELEAEPPTPETQEKHQSCAATIRAAIAAIKAADEVTGDNPALFISALEGALMCVLSQLVTDRVLHAMTEQKAGPIDPKKGLLEAYRGISSDIAGEVFDNLGNQLIPGVHDAVQRTLERTLAMKGASAEILYGEGGDHE